MGMSTHVVAVRQLDNASEFNKMLQVKAACETANISYPQECVDFFKKVSGCHPGESEEVLIEYAQDINLEYDTGKYPELKGICSEYKSDMCEGYEIDVRKIPPWIEKIRFYNSW